MDTDTRDDERTAVQLTEHYRLLSLPYGSLIVNAHDSLLPTNLRENQGEIAELCRMAKGVVLDVGANIGTHSVNFSRVAEVVHAFEPQPVTYRNLCANLLLNVCSNVIPYQLALGEENGIAHMTAYDPTREGSPMGCFLSGDGPQSIRIQTIDSLALSPVHFIKIDVEGHELCVLKGAIETLKRERLIVYVEIHHDWLVSEIEAFMSGLAYHSRQMLQVNTTIEGEEKILTYGYLYWKEGRITWQEQH